MFISFLTIEMSKRQLVEELHAPVRKHFQRRKVIIKGIDDLFQADLVDMSAYAKQNRGFHFLLTVIDTFSKFAWAVPLKDKSGLNVMRALSTVFKEGRIPKNLQTDDGTEFYNKDVKRLLDEHQINHYSVYTHLKASIIERWNRTLKNAMWKEFSMNGSYRWIDMIQTLCNDYNNSFHRTIKMKPIEVNKSNEQKLLREIYKVDEPYLVKAKFHVGQHVRISKYKHVFEKGYTPNWTTEIFKIAEVRYTNPETYHLVDGLGNPIKGGFYKYELQSVSDPKLCLVEKVIQRKGNQVYVKWLGFSEEHNSWINKNELL